MKTNTKLETMEQRQKRELAWLRKRSPQEKKQLREQLAQQLFGSRK